MGMGSELFHIVPSDIKVNPTKLNKDEIQRIWHIDFEKDEEQLVSDLFMPELECVKLMGYLNHKYILMIEHLFRNIMMQNSDVQRMEWHFELDAGYPYYFYIDRNDMTSQQYAVKIVLALYEEFSVYYYDTPVDDERPKFNKEKYLEHYKTHMKSPTPLVSQMNEIQFLPWVRSGLITWDRYMRVAWDD